MQANWGGKTFLKKFSLPSCNSPSSRFGLYAADVVCDEESHSAALGEAAGNTATVAYEVAAVHNLKIAVMLGTDTVIFIFATVEECVGIRRTGGDLIEGVDSLDDIGQRTVRQHDGKVSRESFQGGDDRVCFEAVLICTSAAD